MKLHARRALLPHGWADDVLLSISQDGTIDAIAHGPRGPDAEAARGPVVPGMPNVHSHAFQRALAGRTGAIGGGSHDSFWTWREAMYAFAARADADAIQAIAAQAFVEMAKAGYTTLAEFHYLHHDPGGAPYADRAELSRRIVAAAAEAGLGLTLLPAFYAHGGFGGRPPASAQRRFVHSVDAFAALLADLAPLARDAGVRLGVAPHSLRAVTPDELETVVGAVPVDAPVHIHAAEQRREVDECVASLGARPIEWLLDHARVGPRWCIVHATHMTREETVRLAASGAVAGLAPTTESDLGDGIFPGAEFLHAGGRFGIGSDSNTTLDPFAELRTLEWSQRLRYEARHCLADAGERGTIATRLWTHAARAGARAVGRNAGEIAPGCRADLVVLDDEAPAIATAAPDAVLDAAMFGPARQPVRDVMANGRWIVRDGRHAEERAIEARFRRAMSALAEGDA
jgi:formimidoylglutamate deiminase